MPSPDMVDAFHDGLRLAGFVGGYIAIVLFIIRFFQVATGNDDPFEDQADSRADVDGASEFHEEGASL